MISKTSDYSIAGTEAFGSIFTNSGASAPVKLTLPTCLSGMTVTALVTAAQTFQVGPQATDQIIGPGLTTTSAAGSKISNDGSVLYSLVQLVGICPQWVVAQTMGGEWIDAGP